MELKPGIKLVSESEGVGAHMRDTTAPSSAILIEAQATDFARIENLMQFYNYDLSVWNPV